MHIVYIQYTLSEVLNEVPTLIFVYVLLAILLRVVENYPNKENAKFLIHI